MALVPIGIDFETFWSDTYSLTKMTLAEYVRSPHFKVHGASVKFQGHRAVWISGCDLPAFFTGLDWRKLELIGHNLAFDGLILAEHYGAVPALYSDTLGMSRAINGTALRSHALSSVGTYMGYGGKLDSGAALMSTKGVRDLSPDQEEHLAQYAGWDIELTWLIYGDLVAQMPAGEREILDMTIRMTTQPAIVIDAPMLREMHADEVALKAQVMQEADADRDTLMSNQKFAERLQALGVTPPLKISPTTGKETYAFAKQDKDFIALLDHEDPKVAALVGARLQVKTTLIETRALKLATVGLTGPLPAELNYAGAMTTLRFSGGGSLNLQNMPRKSKLRKALMAPKGYTFVVADQSQIELRVGAGLARQQSILDNLRAGGCEYSGFASLIYGEDVNKKRAKTDPRIADMRQVGKVAVLSLQYGAGAETFRHMLWVQTGGKQSIDLQEAKRIVYLYRRSYANVPQFWDALDVQLRLWCMPQSDELADHIKHPFLVVTRGNIAGPSGLSLKYPDMKIGRGGMSYAAAQKSTDGRVFIYGGKLMENLSQHIARVTMTDCMRVLRNRFRIVLTVHDELVLLVRDSEVEEAVALVTSVMSTSPQWWPTLPVSCEVGTGTRYGDAK